VLIDLKKSEKLRNFKKAEL